MTPAEFSALLDSHGGMVSDAVALDAQIDNPNPIDAKLRPKVPNPNPTYRYVLKDGTQLEARAATDANGNVDTSNIQITNPGTATAPPKPSSAQPTPTGQLDKIDAQGNLIPPGSTAVPAKLRDPATGTTIDLPDPAKQPEGKVQEFGNQLLLIKPDGTYTVIASKTTTAAQQATTTFDGPDGGRYEYDPNKPEGQRVTQLLAPPADKKAPTTKTVNGKTFQWNPETGKWDESNLPVETQKPDVSGAADIIWQDIPGSDPPQEQAVRIVNGERVEVAGLTRPKGEATTLIGNADSKTWTFVDKQGNVVRTVPNPDYREPVPTQWQPDNISPNVLMMMPDGTLKWVPNQNRVTNGQAMTDLLGQAGIKVNNGDLSMDDAKNMLTGAVNLMNAQTAQQQAATAQQAQVRGAATDILNYTQQVAGTGANLLQNRVSNASNMLNTVLGLAGQGQRSGNMGGGLMSVPAGLGANIIGGIGGWTTELGGGPGVYETAARLVQQADPSGNMMTPQAQTAYGVLGQMLEKWQQTTGQPHPAVAATTAALASQQNGGMTAPDLLAQQAAQREAQRVAAAQAAAQEEAAARAAYAQFVGPPAYGPATPVGAIPMEGFSPQQFVAPQTVLLSGALGGGSGTRLI